MENIEGTFKKSTEVQFYVSGFRFIKKTADSSARIKDKFPRVIPPMSHLST